MLKTLTAHTAEIDDCEAAVAEILDQLDLENNLLSHSAAILSCYSEFIDTGVVRSLCDKLPFPVIGTTTLATAVTGDLGQLLLGIMVLTSDDIFFSAALTDNLEHELEATVAAAYEKARRQLEGKPELILTAAPLLFHQAGDLYVEILDKVSGGVPNFGAITVDHTSDYRYASVLYNGEAYRKSLAVLLLSGNVSPKFHLATISEKKILKQTAVITDSEGNILKEVNGLPLAAYLETLGLASDGKVSKGLNSIPFVLDYNDGSEPIVRAMFAITDEGYAVCGGLMPVGSTIAIGAIDREDVLSTSIKTVNRALPEGENALLMYSCIGRNMALGIDNTAGMRSVNETVRDRIPFLLCYSGGEICPVGHRDGLSSNRFHNDTFIACTL